MPSKLNKSARQAGSVPPNFNDKISEHATYKVSRVITPVTHLFSAIYRGPITPCINVVWAHLVDMIFTTTSAPRSMFFFTTGGIDLSVRGWRGNPTSAAKGKDIPKVSKQDSPQTIQTHPIHPHERMI